mgnify:FL=1
MATKRTINFYLLKIGDYFYYEKKKYKKISDNKARLNGRGRIEIFWDQYTCLLYKPLCEKEYFRKYPQAALTQFRSLEKDYSFSV